MVIGIEAPPVEATDFWSGMIENRVDPVEDRFEMVFELVDVVVAAMLRHIVFDLAGTDPLERGFEDRLAFWAPADVSLPSIHFGVSGVRNSARP